MESQAFLEICGRLLRHPSAAYFEHAVRAEAEAICAEAGLRTRRDRFGNLFAELVTAPNQAPVVLSAHMDHPGFQVLRALGPNRWLARFRGGVPDDYFRPGLKVRLMPGGIVARLGERISEPRRGTDSRGKPPEKIFEVTSEGPPPDGGRAEFGVWDLTDFEHRGGRIVARGCDDLIGVAAILATLIDLKRARARVNVIGAITRAEEVGFHGALALAAGGGIPGNSLVISLETSKELPGVKMGRGVILRVGDKASIFDSEGTRFLAEVAAELEDRQRAGRDASPRRPPTPNALVEAALPFRFQRALMSGGTCEATAYQEYGYRAVAVCVALGNYHNCGPGKKIRAEYVDLGDALSMVELLAVVAREFRHYQRYAARLRRRLGGLLAEAKRELPRSA